MTAALEVNLVLLRSTYFLKMLSVNFFSWLARVEDRIWSNETLPNAITDHSFRGIGVTV
jgi:hypothetical protein